MLHLRRILLICLPAAFALCAHAQTPELAPALKTFVRVQAPRVILTHVRVIDGTGAPAIDDQNITIEHGKITSIDKGADVAPSANLTVLNLSGYSVMPGIVGMHNHLFYIARPNLTARKQS